MEKVVTMCLLKIVLWFILFQSVEILAAREPPMVTLPEQGILMGTVLKMFRTQRIVAYLGLPYAQPPVMGNRFSPPVVDNLPSWDGIRNASQLMPDCWQAQPNPGKKHEELFNTLLGVSRNEEPRVYEEDCLFLNIYIPDAPPPSEGYAVIVWFHSGDFQYGSPSELDPFQIVLKQRVIIITVAYRLNIFGFFTSLDGEAPGNFGLMDQSASLLWIKKNIKLFGGNDTSITIMGQGSGAISVSLHLTSGIWSEDNFHKAIIMSGSSFSDTSIRTAKSYTSSVDRLAKTFGCFRRPTSKMMECLRNLSPATLFTSNPIKDWGPIVDMNLSNSTMAFIRDFPSMMTAETSYLKNVPVMIGFTDSEEALDAPMGAMMDEGLTPDMFESLIQDMILNDLSEFDSNDTCMGNNNIVLDAVNFIYKPFPPVKDNMMLRKKFVDFNTDRKYLSPTIQLATLLSKQSETYVYRFDIKPKTPAAIEGLPAWIGVPHRYDLIFIWGMPYWVVLPDEMQWVNSDKRVTDIIMTLWMNFAKYTNPTEIGVYIKWDKFTIESPGVLIVDRSFNMSDSDNFNYNSVQFWNDYYPKVVTFASQCCNSTNSGSKYVLRIPILLLPGFLLFYHKTISSST